MANKMRLANKNDLLQDTRSKDSPTMIGDQLSFLLLHPVRKVPIDGVCPLKKTAPLGEDQELHLDLIPFEFYLYSNLA